MTATALRREIHGIIDVIPDKSLPALRPILTQFEDDYWTPAIEMASPEEAALHAARMADYDRDPASFVPLESIG